MKFVLVWLGLSLSLFACNNAPNHLIFALGVVLMVLALLPDFRALAVARDQDEDRVHTAKVRVLDRDRARSRSRNQF
jgi:hypothetical protein